jgi:hypothetical protein
LEIVQKILSGTTWIDTLRSNINYIHSIRLDFSLALQGKIAFTIFVLTSIFIVNFRISRELNSQRQTKEEAELLMQHLMNLVQHTAVSVFLY